MNDKKNFFLWIIFFLYPKTKIEKKFYQINRTHSLSDHRKSWNNVYQSIWYLCHWQRLLSILFFFLGIQMFDTTAIIFFWLLSNVCCMLWNDEIQSRSICKWKNLNWIHVSCMQSIIDYFIFISCFFSIWHSLRSIII